MSILTADAPTATSATPPRIRAWFWGTAALAILTGVAKYPTLHRVVVSQATDGPDPDGLPPGMFDSAVTIGVGMGVFMSTLVSLLVLALVSQLARRSSPGFSQRFFPFWLSGVITTGLVLPDVLVLLTGVPQIWTAPLPLAVYIAVAALAAVMSPAPRIRSQRIVDLALIAFLPLV